MAPVGSPTYSLPPRTPREWGEAYQLLNPTTNQKILEIIAEMERELGQTALDGDLGQLGNAIAQFSTVCDTEDYHILEGKHQAFAELYRAFEMHFTRVRQLQINLDLLLGSNQDIDPTIHNKRVLLVAKMAAMEVSFTELVKQKSTLTAVPYNRIFQAAAKVFISGPFNIISSFLKTKKVETLAVVSFVTIAGYSIATKTHSSLIMKALAPLFFMYIGHIFSKTFRSYSQPSGQQEIRISVTPPGSPVR